MKFRSKIAQNGPICEISVISVRIFHVALFIPQINMVLMVACVFTMALPVYIHFYVKKKTKAAESAMKTDEKKGTENPAMTLDDEPKDV